MLSKKILLPIVAICGLSMSASFQSCETLGQLGGEMTPEQRQQLIGGLIFDGLNSLAGGGDSLTALAGVWVAAGQGVQDTVVFTTNGQFQQHYASDSLNYVEKGTYVYYKSFRQVLVETNFLYNCLTRKQVKWEQKYIEQLDNDPTSATYGQSLGATQYSAVKVATNSQNTQSSRSAQGTRSNLNNQKTPTTQKTQATQKTPTTPRTQTTRKVIRLR